MPEIGEVERLRNHLCDYLPGRNVERFTAPINSTNPKRYVLGDWDTFSTGVKAGTIITVHRYGKHLFIMLTNGMWRVHMSSTGWFTREGTAGPAIEQGFLHPIKPENIKLRFHTDDGATWNWHDQRTWGRWDWSLNQFNPLAHPALKDYGPDWILQPMDAALALQDAKRGTVQTALTDQHIACGVGYYLSLEALHRTKIRPDRKTASLSANEKWMLAGAIQEQIKLALNSHNHDHWKVFRRKTCGTCGGPITHKRNDKGGRGLYYCEECQL
jgi:formamidopyrimidine-DNA glycosylase